MLTAYEGYNCGSWNGSSRRIKLQDTRNISAFDLGNSKVTQKTGYREYGSYNNSTTKFKFLGQGKK